MLGVREGGASRIPEWSGSGCVNAERSGAQTEGGIEGMECALGGMMGADGCGESPFVPTHAAAGGAAGAATAVAAAAAA